MLSALPAAYAAAAAEAQDVSYFRDVLPVLKSNCQGCHRPGKLKGQLDLTTVAAMRKGGKHGAVFEGGTSSSSALVENISGPEPEMPPEGEPLSAAEVELITRWIAQGAHDDTPADGGLHRLAGPPIYRALPSIAALAWSPDGSVLAIAGHHEILLQRPDGQGLLGRLPGYSPSISALAFSPDGKVLAAAGGATSEYGEVQLWEVAKQKLLRSIRTSNDTVFGISFSPDGSRVAVGCADKLVRVFSALDGTETMRCDNHIDWVFATVFTQDGQRLVTGSRDRAVKLIEVANGHLIDDVSKPRDSVLSLSRHPQEDLVVIGDEKGALRIFRMAPRGGRLAEGDDKEESFVRECERMSGPVHALAWSPDGKSFAAASASGEAAQFNADNGKRVAVFKGNAGPVFAVAFSPDSQEIATAGYDGKVRVFAAGKGELLRAFDAAPITASPGATAQQSAK